MEKDNVNASKYNVVRKISNTESIVRLNDKLVNVRVFSFHLIPMFKTVKDLSLPYIPEIYSINLLADEMKCEVLSEYINPDDYVNVLDAETISVDEGRKILTIMADAQAAYHGTGLSDWIRPSLPTLAKTNEGRYVFTDYAVIVDRKHISIYEIGNTAHLMNSFYFTACMIASKLETQKYGLVDEDSDEAKLKRILTKCRNAAYPDPATLLYDLENWTDENVPKFKFGFDFIEDEDNTDEYEILKKDFEKGFVLIRARDTGLLYIQKEYPKDKVDIKTYRLLQSKWFFFGIPEIREVRERDNTVVVVEQFVNGRTLLSAFNECKANAATARFLLENLCDILKQLQPYIINRDLTPSNIIIDDNFRLYIVDHNAALIYGISHEENHLGSPGFASPEQVFGRDSTLSTDIWGIGTTMMYIMGFDYTNDSEIPDEFNDPDLIQILRKCVPPREERREENRYQDVFELEYDLINGYGSKPEAKAPRVRKKNKKKFKRFVVTALILVAAVIGGLSIYDSMTRWEKPNSADAGKLQVAESEIKSPYVVAVYETDFSPKRKKTFDEKIFELSRHKETRDEEHASLNKLKANLEDIGSPYAIGVRKRDGIKETLVKIEGKQLSENKLKVIGGPGLIEMATTDAAASCDLAGNTKLIENNGKYSLKITLPSEYVKDDAQDFFKYRSSIKSDEVLISINRCYIAKGVFEDDHTIVINKPMDGQKSINNSNVWALHQIEKSLNASGKRVIHRYWYSEPSKGYQLDSYVDESIRGIKGKIEALDSNYLVHATNEDLLVELNLDADSSNFVDQTVERLDEIIDTSGFRQNALTYIAIYADSESKYAYIINKTSIAESGSPKYTLSTPINDSGKFEHNDTLEYAIEKYLDENMSDTY